MCESTSIFEADNLYLLLFILFSSFSAFFNDDTALRNSEIHLLKEILAHPSLLQPLMEESKSPEEEEEEEDEGEGEEKGKEAKMNAAPLPTLNAANTIVTILEAIQLARENGQNDRKSNYVLL